MLKKSLWIWVFLHSGLVWAQLTPVGLWKTVDENTGQARSLIRIAETGGVYTGRVEKSLDPTSKPGALCHKCDDDRKDKPIIGLDIIRGIRANRDEPGLFDGGEVVDPESGRIYRFSLKPIEMGAKLRVRGYFGPFFLSQVWLRAE